MSIDRHHAISLLSGIMPRLKEEANRIHVDWQPEQPPFTVLMSELGRVLGSNVGSLSGSAIARIAETIETVLRTGNDEVKDAVATGFLEAVLASPEGEDGTAPLLRSLGPESARYCREWDKFTGRKTPGL